MDGLSRPTRISADDLVAGCSRILVVAGTPRDSADVVGRSLASAELRGLGSHGVSRLPAYIRRIQAGLIQPAAELTVVRESASTVTVDAGAGFGHAAGWHAMGRAMAKAATQGIGAASVRNSTHFGTAGFFAERAASAGMIGVATSNGAALMAPPDTRTRVLGTNPIAIAFPSTGDEPIVLDMATSTAALGKILLARDAGTSIPAHWALDLDGNPTMDPRIAATGLLTPLGGHKGFGLALALEVLSAGLSGAAAGPNAGSMYRTWDRPENLGHWFLAVDPRAFAGLEVFLATVGALASAIHAAEPLPERNGALLPGEVERRQEAISRREGILVTPSMAESVETAAQMVGAGSPWA